MTRFAIPALAALVAAFSFPAQAQQVCTMRAELVKILGDKYKEAPSGQGLVGDRVMLELFVSDAGTFSIVSSYPNGVACIIAAGNSWEAMELPKPGDEM